MVSLDTNVVVRVLVNDDRQQQLQVVTRLRSLQASGTLVFVSSVVLAEVTWVLESGYGYGRDQIAQALGRLLMTTPFHVHERDAVSEALMLYESGSADFSDYLILSLSAAQGAAPLLTFDKKLLRQEGCTQP